MSEFRLPVLDSNVTALCEANTLVFIDAALDSNLSLSAEALGEANTILLNPKEDGVAQITATLARYRNLEKLHIVSLSSSEGLYLGNGFLTLDTLHTYVHPLMAWTDSLKPNAAIFLYGCNAAFSRLGMELAAKLSHLTGVSIAVA